MNPIYRIESELPMSQRYDLPQLLDIMARLRDPNGGCPWDLKQSFQTIVPHTLEEAYEVADAIETILDTYLKHREPGEEFLATYRRLGAKPFKEALYATA